MEVGQGKVIWQRKNLNGHGGVVMVFFIFPVIIKDKRA
jgi:hypothetical protein